MFNVGEPKESNTPPRKKLHQYIDITDVRESIG